MENRKFNLHNFAGVTILSREEMKNVKGSLSDTIGTADGDPCLPPNAYCGPGEVLNVVQDIHVRTREMEKVPDRVKTNFAHGNYLIFNLEMPEFPSN